MQKPVKTNGFALVEFLLVVVIIGLLAGVTAYVVTQKNNSNKVFNTAVSSSEGTEKAAPGTTGNIDDLTQADAASEQQAAAGNDSATQGAGSSDASTLNNLGGAYDESTL
jgi:prepilin-type N-terminal cleavage/methylation domain-containing protein